MRAVPLVLVALVSGCQNAEQPVVDVFRPDYKGVETRLLEGDLVNFLVTMEGARDPQDVLDYAECAASQYALIRGFGFARQVRTNVVEEGGLWRGDAVYTVSPALPRGLRTIDAEVAVETCRDKGIPTI
ncbi:hypothetical protein [Jannaschia donghaensis]|uniref:Lipoprotein n=1 Tax=Jannaschia donghaensis TaxID=420998 RepID=A0A0M6YH12_9RHOB|nr:hypothetical protein [Jannaschia donghaensis]CTQ49638.1 hypothetical protein JDO7802_01652 [Jannaschia donghaensis]